MPTADAAVWREAGHAVYERRIELGMQSQTELAERAGVSLNSVSRLERGVPSKRRSPTWGPIERALGWPEGKIEDMIEGRASDVLTAEAVRQAVLDAIHDVEPDVTVKQANEIAGITIERLRQRKMLPKERR
jgi:transcriptional regulator with XRE-family HTH domain